MNRDKEADPVEQAIDIVMKSEDKFDVNQLNIFRTVTLAHNEFEAAQKAIHCCVEVVSYSSALKVSEQIIMRAICPQTCQVYIGDFISRENLSTQKLTNNLTN